MDFMGTLLWVMLVPAGLAALYGLHRLGLWMEQRGWLYYWHKKPGAGARSFVALACWVIPAMLSSLCYRRGRARMHAGHGPGLPQMPTSRSWSISTNSVIRPANLPAISSL